MDVPHGMVHGGCGWCYATQSSLEAKMLRCGKCKKRVYCSKSCQLNDWKSGGHKHWCSRSGELGYDVAIRPVEGKGVGLFALRKLTAGEKLLVERSAGTKGDPLLAERMPQGMRRAAAALMPCADERLSSKFDLNGFEMDDGSEGLFIHMASANHDCLPNAVHHSVASQNGIKLLVAGRDIEEGEEICHSYVSLEGAGQLAQRGQTRASFLSEVWGFTCTCRACTDPACGAKLERMRELDVAIVDACASDVRAPNGASKFDEALRHGDELLALYENLRCSPNHFARTYHHLFLLGVTRRATLPQARLHIELARRSRVLLVGSATADEEVRRLEKLVAAPETHQAYMAGEAF